MLHYNIICFFLCLLQVLSFELAVCCSLSHILAGYVLFFLFDCFIIGGRAVAFYLFHKYCFITATCLLGYYPDYQLDTLLIDTFQTECIERKNVLCCQKKTNQTQGYKSLECFCSWFIDNWKKKKKLYKKNKLSYMNRYLRY